MAAQQAVVASRPLVIGAVVLCAIGTLGVVSNASAPLHRVGRAPGIADVLRVHPGRVTVGSAAAIAVATVVALLALRWSVRRSWPWLILAGVLLTLPAEFVYVSSTRLEPRPDWVVGLAAAAGQLVLLGVLGAGIHLVRIGTGGAGAVLITAAFGAQIFGASTDISFARTMELRPGDPGTIVELFMFTQQALHQLMFLAAAGGAMLLLALHRAYGTRPELDGVPARGPGEPEPGGQMTWRLMLAGCAAGLLFPLAAALSPGHGRIFSTAGCALLLAGAALLAALAGPRTLAGVVIAGLALTGIAGPVAGLIRYSSSAPLSLWFLVALGVVVGGAATLTSRRTRSAAVAGVVAGLLLLLLALTGPGSASRLLIIVLVAAATSAVTVVGVRLAEESATASALGSLTIAGVIGACGLLTRWQTGGTRPAEELLRSPGLLCLSAALIMLAAGSLVVHERYLYAGDLPKSRSS